MKTTIVSALIDTSSKYRSIDKYIELGKKLIDLPFPKIIFIDEKLSSLLPKNDLTLYINFVWKDVSLFEREEEIKNLKCSSNCPIKDTYQYHIINLEKTEWVRRAVTINPFKTDNFMWIDFGVFHMLKSDPTEKLSNILQKDRNKVVIPGCYHPDKTPAKYFHYPLWCFCGTIFIGDKTSLIKFADLIKKKREEIYFENRIISWEVNLWAVSYDETIIEWVYGDHNDKILLEL